MDRVAILIVMLVALVVWLSKEGSRISYPKFAENIVAFYVFSCCFIRLGIPIFTLPYEQTYGPLGIVVRFEMFHFLILFFLWVVARERDWKLSRIKQLPVLVILFYLLLTAVNPYNVVKPAALVGWNFILSYLLFLYLLTTCCSIETIVKGIFKGFAITVVLHFVLAMLYPVLGMRSVVTLFNYGAVIRRGGTPGTFGHPNALGAYASFYMMFFLSCAFLKYKTRKSYVFVLMSIIVIILSGSRSALLAGMFGAVMLIVMYVFRRYSLFNVKIFFMCVLPIVIVIGCIFYFTPLSELFGDDSDAGDMALARLMHYYCAYEIFMDHPLIGVGFNSHLRYLLDNSAVIDIETMFEGFKFWMPDEFMFTNPIHNMWLILLTEFGIIGILPILSFIVYYFYSFKKRIRNSSSKYYNVALMTGLGILSCMFVHGNSDWALLSASVLKISLLFFFLSCCTSYAKEHDEENIYSNDISARYER